MIYVMGVLGFFGGFIVGQMILYFLLRHKSNKELLEDKGLKLKYGLVGWGCAALGAYGLMKLYELTFIAG